MQVNINKQKEQYMEDNTTQTKPASLLEIGDQYVQATWNHPQSPTEIIGIFRLNSRGQYWSMSQPLRGPWSVVVNGKVTNDHSAFQKAYRDTSVHAMALFEVLATQGPDAAKQRWEAEGGTIYDY
jgi:hypothetical protein